MYIYVYIYICGTCWAPTKKQRSWWIFRSIAHVGDSSGGQVTSVFVTSVFVSSVFSGGKFYFSIRYFSIQRRNKY